MIFQYRVTGVVVQDETGQPLVGLVVRGWDKDLVFDDHLGDTVTDVDGRFVLKFTDEPFRHVFDQNPDLYLRIYDPSGRRELHSTRAQVRRSAGAEEHYDIRISGDPLTE